MPSRKRLRSLLNSVVCLQQEFDYSNGDDLEVLVATDEDDDSYDGRLPSICKQITCPRHGYQGLHNYYNRLCEVATGDWLWLFNDDCFVKTTAWNRNLAQYAGKFLVLNPLANLEPVVGTNSHAVKNCVFALVPRRWYEILGHFSINRHNDVYIYAVGTKLGIITNVDVEVCHQRFDLTGHNGDDTYHESREHAYDFARLFDGDQVEAVNSAVAKIRQEIQ